jgi:hypothetical protein
LSEGKNTASHAAIADFCFIFAAIFIAAKSQGRQASLLLFSDVLCFGVQNFLSLLGKDPKRNKK